MHSNPFTAAGYDLADLNRKIEQKADRHEISTLRSAMDRLECSLREACAEIAGLCSRCDILQEDFDRQRHENSQFDVGA